MTTKSSAHSDLENIMLDIGKHLPGSPTFLCNLTIDTAGIIKGTVEIKQVVSPPFVDIHVSVQGRLSIFDPIESEFAYFQGHYPVSFPPPAIGMYYALLEISVRLNGQDWDGGIANVTYAGGHLQNLPVKVVN